MATLLMAALRYHIYVGRPAKRAIFRSLEARGPYFDIGADGLKFRCRANDNGGEAIVINRRKLNSRPELVHITSGLKAGDTFVDIGANFGLFTLYGAKAVGRAGTVLAIEASPSMVDRLRFNIAANDFAQVAVAPVAVGENFSTAVFHVPSAQQDRASLHPVEGEDSQFSVPVQPLLAILEEHGIHRIDAMKIDIEGYEDRALFPFFAAAPRTLWPARILIENNKHLWERDCIELMRARGYQVKWQGRIDTLLTLAP